MSVKEYGSSKKTNTRLMAAGILTVPDQISPPTTSIRNKAITTNPALSTRAVYTVAEVASLLDLSIGGTYTLVRSGQIPAKKMGGRWVIPKRRFHIWLDGETE